MRYFFDVRCAEFVRDERGVELDDPEAARLHAVALSADLLKPYSETFWRGAAWQVEVRDEAGALRLVLNVMATDAPDVPPPRADGRSQPGSR